MGAIIIPLILGMIISAATFNYAYSAISTQESMTVANDNSTSAAEIAVAGIHIAKDGLIKNTNWTSTSIPINSNDTSFGSGFTYLNSETLNNKIIKNYDINPNNKMTENLNLLYKIVPASGNNPLTAYVFSEGKINRSKVMLGTKFKITNLPIVLPTAFSKTSSYSNTTFCSVDQSQLGYTGNKNPTYLANPNINIISSSNTNLSSTSIAGSGTPTNLSIYMDSPVGSTSNVELTTPYEVTTKITNIYTDATGVTNSPVGATTTSNYTMPNLLSNNILNSPTPTQYVNYPALNTIVNYPATSSISCSTTNGILPNNEYNTVIIPKNKTCTLNIDASSSSQNYYINTLDLGSGGASLIINITNSYSNLPITLNVGKIIMYDSNANQAVDSHISVNNNTGNTSFVTIKADSLQMSKMSDVVTNNITAFLLDVNTINTNNGANYSLNAANINLQGTIIARTSANLGGASLLGNIIANNLITSNTRLCNVLDASGNVLSPVSKTDFFNITSYSSSSYQGSPILDAVLSSICKDITTCF